MLVPILIKGTDWGKAGRKAGMKAVPAARLSPMCSAPCGRLGGPLLDAPGCRRSGGETPGMSKGTRFTGSVSARDARTPLLACFPPGRYELRQRVDGMVEIATVAPRA